jgi:hypothetical protein
MAFDQKAYLRAWKKAHPHYNRDYMRRMRGSLGHTKSDPKVTILGIRVIPNLLHKILHRKEVPK